ASGLGGISCESMWVLYCGTLIHRCGDEIDSHCEYVGLNSDMVIDLNTWVLVVSNLGAMIGLAVMVRHGMERESELRDRRHEDSIRQMREEIVLRDNALKEEIRLRDENMKLWVEMLLEGRGRDNGPGDNWDKPYQGKCPRGPICLLFLCLHPVTYKLPSSFRPTGLPVSSQNLFKAWQQPNRGIFRDKLEKKSKLTTCCPK
ncbi:8375_t:CDS:2, partial [Funneliformis geosporum]